MNKVFLLPIKAGYTTSRIETSRNHWRNRHLSAHLPLITVFSAVLSAKITVYDLQEKAGVASLP
jgi:hypothetical protein